MKVLIINYEFPPLGGGTGIANYYLLKELAKEKDLQIDLITSSLDRYKEEFFSENIRIYRLDIGKRGKNPHYQSNQNLITFFLKSTYFVLKNRSNYDFIHAFSGLPCGITAYLSGKPYLVSLRGASVPGYDSDYDFFYKITWPFIKFSWQKAKFIDANSHFLKKLALKNYPQLKIKVIHNGIDLKEFAAARKLTTEPILLSNSRFCKRKGVYYLLQAMPEILEALPKTKLILIGNGYEKKELQNLAQKLKIKRNISFLGVIKHERIPSFYRQTSIFIIPSLVESFSNSLLEALSCGLPVVASSVGGNKELVSRKNGILVPPANSEAIAKAVIRLLKDKSLRLKVSKESLKIAKKFSWEEAAKQYLSLYRRIKKAAAKENFS